MQLTILKTAKDGILSVVKPVMAKVVRHSPEILTGAGVVSILGGTALACRATLKADHILKAEMQEEQEDEEQSRKQAIRAGLEVAKVYAAPTLMVLGGTSFLIAAKSIEHRRFMAALGAYSTLQTMFDEYRVRVVEEAGAEADLKYLNGATMEPVSYLPEGEDADGKKPKKVKEDFPAYSSENPYHRVFDEYNSPMYWQNNMEDNRFFLECQQAILNQDLNRDGRIFLNDVYKRLGFEYTEIGQFVGWLASDIEGSKDGCIDFGIDYACLKREIEMAQLEGRKPEPSIWLTFNCDGEVWDKPLKKKREEYL